MKTIISAFSITVLCLPTIGQQLSRDPYDSEKKEVLSVVLDLFEGYRLGDADRVEAVFTNNAQMQRVQQKDGKAIVTEMVSVQGWIDYIRAGLNEAHDEPTWNYEINFDGDLAHVWTKYALYLGGKFHHCGVDSFLLVRKDDSWKIFHIADTSQTEGCDIPEKIRQKSEGM